MALVKEHISFVQNALNATNSKSLQVSRNVLVSLVAAASRVVDEEHYLEDVKRAHRRELQRLKMERRALQARIRYLEEKERRGG